MIAGLRAADGGTLSGNYGATAFVFQDNWLLPWRNVWKNIRLVREWEDTESIARLIRDVEYFPTDYDQISINPSEKSNRYSQKDSL